MLKPKLTQAQIRRIAACAGACAGRTRRVEAARAIDAVRPPRHARRADAVVGGADRQPR